MSRALDSGNSPRGRSPYLPNVTSCAERFEAGEGVAKVLRNRVLLSLHESGAYGARIRRQIFTLLRLGALLLR
jgi:hypothetical protein